MFPFNVASQCPTRFILFLTNGTNKACVSHLMLQQEVFGAKKFLAHLTPMLLDVKILDMDSSSFLRLEKGATRPTLYFSIFNLKQKHILKILRCRIESSTYFNIIYVIM